MEKLQANHRHLACTVCEEGIHVYGTDEFNRINDENGPYCNLCFRWASHIYELTQRVAKLEEKNRRPSPYDAGVVIGSAARKANKCPHRPRFINCQCAIH